MKKTSGSRSKILSILREQDCTVRDLATRLGLTNNAIRAHLAALQEDGLVRRGGYQSGTRKPHHVYTLTENAEHAFPNAYGLLLRELVDVLVAQLAPRALTACLRQVGRQLGSEPAARAEGKTAGERRRIALKVFASLGGDATLQTKNGSATIEGRSCPLSALTAPYPQACVIAQTVLSEILGQPVEEVCLHGPRPRCRFRTYA